MTTLDFRLDQSPIGVAGATLTASVASDQAPVSHPSTGARGICADGTQSAGGQSPFDTHIGVAASVKPLDGPSVRDAQDASAVEDQAPPGATDDALPNLPARPAEITIDQAAAAWFDVQISAASLDDIEGVWISASNRLRAMRDSSMFGVSLEGLPAERRQAELVHTLTALVKTATRRLEKAMRAHPLGPWTKAQRGLGDKQVGRLLNSTGDPYWNTLHDRPRTVSELWAYCGLHVLPAGQSPADTHAKLAGGDQTSSPDLRTSALGLGHLTPVGVAAKRRKGQKANWSATAKMRAYLIATSCMKQPDGSRYRDIYVARRAHTAGTHPDWQPIHSHNDGLRIVAKAVLKDLWLASRELHQPAEQVAA